MDVLHTPKAVKNIWHILPMKPIATSSYISSRPVVIRPRWWDKAPLITARVETAATSLMFKTLLQHGLARCFADGWFEWKEKGDKKQPYYIHRAERQSILMAAIDCTPFECGDDAEGFLIVTSAADKGLNDTHGRWPLVLSSEAAREWMRQGIGGKEAEEIVADGEVPVAAWMMLRGSCVGVRSLIDALLP